MSTSIRSTNFPMHSHDLAAGAGRAPKDLFGVAHHVSLSLILVSGTHTPVRLNLCITARTGHSELELYSLAKHNPASIVREKVVHTRCSTHYSSYVTNHFHEHGDALRTTTGRASLQDDVCFPHVNHSTGGLVASWMITGEYPLCMVLIPFFYRCFHFSIRI